MQVFLEQFEPQNLYVVGVIDTNREIEAKYRWLDKYYPFILKENVILITGEHKKVDVINEFVKVKNFKKENIIFVDDKESHLKFAREQQYKCFNVREI